MRTRSRRATSTLSQEQADEIIAEVDALSRKRYEYQRIIADMKTLSDDIRDKVFVLLSRLGTKNVTLAEGPLSSITEYKVPKETIQKNKLLEAGVPLQTILAATKHTESSRLRITPNRDLPVEALLKIQELEVDHEHLWPSWVAVYGGGSRCTDGERHRPKLNWDDSIVCSRCDALLRVQGP